MQTWEYFLTRTGISWTRRRPLVYRDASSFYFHNDTPFHDASLSNDIL